MTKQLSKETLDKMQFVFVVLILMEQEQLYIKIQGKLNEDLFYHKKVFGMIMKKLLTDNYKIVSPQHKDFLKSLLKIQNIQYISESYRRCWTKDINSIIHIMITLMYF